MSSKPERIRQRICDLFFNRCADCIIQTALFLCLFGSHGLVDESILDTFHACNKFHPAGCSQKMSDNRFRRIDNNLICRCSQCIPDCSCLIQIIVMGTGSMCIDVIDLLRLCACLLHRKLHRHPGSLSVFCRRRNMVRISRCPVSDNFCINSGSPLFRMLQFFQHYDPCSLP